VKPRYDSGMAGPPVSGPSETARVEAFSDAVFAIAITLLVLEIRVPQPDLTGHGSTLLPALLGLWPSYLGYLLSCVTIGVMWVNHHSMFVLIRRTDRYFQLISVFFLMCIAFLPFPTWDLLRARLHQPVGEPGSAWFPDRVFPPAGAEADQPSPSDVRPW
jgi:uncharacterized membrane protein